MKRQSVQCYESSQKKDISENKLFSNIYGKKYKSTSLLIQNNDLKCFNNSKKVVNQNMKRIKKFEEFIHKKIEDQSISFSNISKMLSSIHLIASTPKKELDSKLNIKSKYQINKNIDKNIIKSSNQNLFRIDKKSNFFLTELNSLNANNENFINLLKEELYPKNNCFLRLKNKKNNKEYRNISSELNESRKKEVGLNINVIKKNTNYEDMMMDMQCSIQKWKKEEEILKEVKNNVIQLLKRFKSQSDKNKAFLIKINKHDKIKQSNKNSKNIKKNINKRHFHCFDKKKIDKANAKFFFSNFSNKIEKQIFEAKNEQNFIRKYILHSSSSLPCIEESKQRNINKITIHIKPKKMTKKSRPQTEIISPTYKKKLINEKKIINFENYFEKVLREKDPEIFQMNRVSTHLNLRRPSWKLERNNNLSSSKFCGKIGLRRGLSIIF